MPTLTPIANAITARLFASPTLTPYVMAPAAFDESIVEDVTVQVYPERSEEDKFTSTDRFTFGGGLTAPMRAEGQVWNVDVYARQRRHIGEDFAALLPLIDAVVVVFEAEINQPFFGLAGIKSFHWTWDRVIFVYGEPARRYVGARFTVEVLMY